MMRLYRCVPIYRGESLSPVMLRSRRGIRLAEKCKMFCFLCFQMIIFETYCLCTGIWYYKCSVVCSSIAYSEMTVPF